MRRGTTGAMSRYTHHLFFCQHRRDAEDGRGCCAAKGAAALVDIAKQEVADRGWKKSVRVNETGCLNNCAFGPSVVVYPDAVWYRLETAADVRRVLDEHVAQNAPCLSLQVRPAAPPKARSRLEEG